MATNSDGSIVLSVKIDDSNIKPQLVKLKSEIEDMAKRTDKVAASFSKVNTELIKAELQNEKLKQAQEKTAQSVEKTYQAIEKTNQAKLKTSQLDDKTILSAEKVAQAELKTAQQQEKLNSEKAKAAQQSAKQAQEEAKVYNEVFKASSAREKANQEAEKTFQAVERTKQSEEATRQAFEKTFQTQEKSTQEAEKTKQSIERSEQAQEKTKRSVISTEKAQRSLKSATDSVLSSLKKMASTLGIAFGIRELLRFSNEASKLAAKTESNVLRLGQIYGEFVNQVYNFIDANSQALGMSKTVAYEAASSYGNLFSSFADGAENVKLTNAMLRTTAVIASKTGRTFDEVFTKIQSGIFGNTRAIDDLGVYVNQATLTTTKAFQTISDGRPWAQLTGNEQKQILTLAILEQAQIKYGNTVLQSAALTRSQFNAAFEDFKSTWGQLINKILLPILKVMTKIFQYATILLRVVYNLNGVEKASKPLPNLYASISDGINNVSNNQKDMEKSTKKLTKATKELNKELAEFDELTILQSKKNVDDTGNKVGDIASGVGGGVGGGGIDLGNLDEFLDDGDLQTLKDFEEWVTKHKDAIRVALDIAAIGALGLAISNVIGKIGNLLNWFKKKDTGLQNQTQKTKTETSAVEEMANAFATVPAIAYGVVPALDAVTQSGLLLNPTLDTATENAYGLEPAFNRATQGAFNTVPALNSATTNANALIPAFNGATQAVDLLNQTTSIAMPAVSQNVQSSMENSKTNVETFTNTKYSVYDWVDSVASNVLEAADNIGTNIYEAFNSAALNINNFVTNTSESVRNWAESVSKNFASAAKNIAKNWGSALSAAWENFKDFAKATGETVSGFWKEHKATIVGATLAAVAVTAAVALAPYTGGASLALPALARGAVLPANKPFLAMVGDQKNGTNIEAPAKLIKQMAMEAIIEANANNQGQTVKEEHYYLDQTELMSILYKLVKGGERLKGNSLLN